ncbi:MAG: hypothetical protein V4590_06960 [Bacteroidota bacterium]
MKTEAELNDDILKLTLKIQKEHPELSKYITEMPVSVPDEQHPEITVQNLTEYYDSLEKLLKSYGKTHEK